MEFPLARGGIDAAHSQGDRDLLRNVCFEYNIMGGVGRGFAAPIPAPRRSLPLTYASCDEAILFICGNADQPHASNPVATSSDPGCR